MKIGYSMWGYLGDYKYDREGREVSTPDGNAAYSWSIILNAADRGHQVFLMQEDRDEVGSSIHGGDLFKSFSQVRRKQAYIRVSPTRGSFPELDVLLLEWRWPIPGRNCDVDESDPNFQPDLRRQSELINHYMHSKTKIVIWDLDHKLELNDELWIRPRAIIETSALPRKLAMHRIAIEPPTYVDELMQHPTLPCDPKKKLVYVGSRYERDDVIDEWIGPVAARFPGEVVFHGNWDKTLDECRARWPGVEFRGRIAMRDFRSAYGDAVACPLLAKRSYLRTGFITPRIWEALLFGTIPVGLGSHLGIDRYLTLDLVARDAQDLGDIAERLSQMSLEDRDKVRRSVVERISFMDVANLVGVLEAV